MPAFRFFDPWAELETLESEKRSMGLKRPSGAAKAANPAKVHEPTIDTLASLAGLAGAPVEIAVLDTEPAPSGAERANDIWGEVEEERAAIVEHDGGIPREWADGFARLDPDRPPGDVPATRWRRFVDDVGLFLDRWAACAAALGWGPHDLFGCDRDRPFARLDRNGLLWLLNGNRIVALAEDAAAIESRGGVRQTWRRHQPGEPGRVLAWELAS